MKTKTLLTVILFSLWANILFAQQFKVGGINYGITSATAPLTVEVTQKNPRYTGEVIIPETVTNNGNQYGVTKIAQNAFNGCTDLTSVTIPNSVTSIGNTAFFRCSKLTSVSIPNSVTSIGEGAFFDCKKLTEIKVEEGNTKYASIDGVLLNKDKTTLLQYPANKIADTYSIPNSVTHIGDDAFRNCSNLTSVSIPNSVTHIGNTAFVSCSNLTSVTIPSSVTHIGNAVFANCSKLTAINVEANNKNYTSVDGVLFNKNKSRLLQYPKGKSGTTYTIPHSVTRIEGYAFEGCSKLTSVSIPNLLTYIGYFSFDSCSKLTSITIPNSVTNIEYKAFANCSNLATVISHKKTGITTVLQANNVFNNIKANAKLYVPKNTKTTYENANSWTFANENIIELGELTINGTVTANNKLYDGTTSATLTGGALQGLVSGHTVSFTGQFENKAVGNSKKVKVILTGKDAWHYILTQPTNLTANITDKFQVDKLYYQINHTNPTEVAVVPQKDSYPHWDENNKPAGALSLPKTVSYQGKEYKVSSIENNAFSFCSGLTSVSIPNSVTSIGNYAFDSCSNLTSVSIPNSVTSIGNYAFDSCSGLTSVSIPNSVTSIGNNAFTSCKGLTSVSIPNSVTSIGNDAFYGCSKLTSVSIPNSVTHIEKSTFQNCYSLTSVSIPNSVTNIGNDAFNRCLNLTSVTIPNSVTSIGNDAFYGCSKLTSVSIPNSVTSVGNDAFASCSSLTSVSIPNSVTSIGNNAFSYCSKLETIVSYIKKDIATVLQGNGVFYAIKSGAKLYVPKNTKTTYENANNWTFADENIIEFGDLTITGIGIADKTYDGNNTATITGTPTLTGVVPIHNLTLVTTGAGASFSDKNVGTNKALTVTGYTLSGTDKGYYTLMQPTALQANITAKAVSITGVTAESKMYDGNTTATLTGGTLSGEVAGDDLSITAGTGAFTDKNVGENKTVTATGYALDGTDKGNYTLTAQPGSLQANITAKAVSITGVTAENKMYDGNTTATLKGGTLQGVLATETVTFTAGTGAFADKNVGENKTVTATGYALDGTDKDNYTLTAQPSGLQANITAKAVSITGVTAESKMYDGTTTATLTGGTLQGVVGAETVTFTAGTGAFDTKNVGENKTVTATGYALAGTDKGNYTLTQPTGIKANITDTFQVDKLYYQINHTNPTEVTVVRRSNLNLPTGKLNITETVIHEGKEYTVTGIGDSVFQGFTAMTSITLPNTLTTIGNVVFADNPKLKSITIPKSVTSIGHWVFSGCSSLTSIEIPSSVTSIGNYAFNSCINLATIVSYKKTGIASVLQGNKVFNSIKAGAKLYVPKGTKNAYENANNWTFAKENIIEFGDLTITGIDIADKTYDGNNTATITGTPTLTGVVPIHNVTLVTTGAEASFSDKNVGTDKALTVTGYTLSGTDKGYYTLMQPTALKANITAKTVSITDVTAQNKTYDGTTTATLTGGTLQGVLATETVTITAGTGAFADKNVGENKTVTAKEYALAGTDASNYTLTQPTGIKANITAKAVSITGVTAQSKTYDGNTTATLKGGALQGVVGAETVSITAGTGAFADKNVGENKEVTASGYALDGTDKGNYTLTQPTGIKANITAKAVSITGVTAESKVYDGTTTATLTGGTLQGVVGAETVTIKAGTGAFDTKNVGENKEVTASGYALDGTDKGNYTLTAQPSSLQANITAKAVSITGVSAQNKTYDGTTTATLTGGTLQGKIASDDLNFTTGTGAFADKNVGENKTVTAKEYALSGADASNYAITQPTGLKANITAKVITVSAQVRSKAYGEADPTLTYTVSPVLVNSDNFTGKLSRKQGEDVGTYAINQGTLSSGANYSITYNSADFTIGKASLTITAVDKQKNYDGAIFPTADYKVSYNGFVNGETVSVLNGTLSYGGTSQTAKNAGSYAITPSGLTSNNYNISFVDGSLKITKVDLNVIAENKTKVYDGAIFPTADYKVSYNGFVNGETASVLNGTLSYGGTSQTAKNAGSYTIIPTGLTSNNYNISFVDGSLKITKVDLNVIAENKTKVYDGAIFPTADYSVSYNGFVNGETTSVLNGTLSYGGTSQTAKNAGSYTIIPTGLTSNNYNINFVDGSLKITKAVIQNITFNDGTFTYDGSKKSLRIKEELPKGVEVSYENNNQTNAGVYEVIATISGGNYNNAKLTATLTIDKAIQTIRWNQELIIGCDDSKVLQLTAESSSGLPISYSSSNEDIARIDDDSLEVLQQGKSTITASQAGNHNYKPAIAISNELNYQLLSLVKKHWENVLFFDNSSKKYVKWKWFKNGEEVSGANKQYYSEGSALSGNYYVEATDASGNVYKTCPIDVEPSAQAEGIQLYPNPVNIGSNFTVKLEYTASELQNAQLYIATLSGKIVQMVNKVTKSTVLQAPTASGIYVVSVRFTNGKKASANLWVR